MAMPPEININLLPHDSKKHRALLVATAIAFISAILLLIMVIIYFNQAEQISRARTLNRQLNQEITKYQPAQAAFAHDLALEKQLSAQEKMVQNLNDPGLPASRMLEQISRTLPARVEAISISLSGNDIVVKGYAPDFTSVARVTAAMRTSSNFDDAKIINSSVEEDSGEITFEIDVTWKGAKL